MRLDSASSCVALSKSFNLSVLSNYMTVCVAEKVAWEEVAIIPFFLDV